MLGPAFQLDLSQPQSHARVRLSFRAQQERESIALPSWTPGSYLERDYVRHLEGLQARVNGVPAQLDRRHAISGGWRTCRLGPPLSWITAFWG